MSRRSFFFSFSLGVLQHTARGLLVISVLITLDANDAGIARQKLLVAIVRAYRGRGRVSPEPRCILNEIDS